MTAPALAQPIVFLDRDGTLIVEKHYLHDPAEVELYPGTGAALARLRNLGCRLILVTNQSGVARGYFDRAAVERVHQRLSELLAIENAGLDGFYVCPHGPEDGCRCRKPLPGMIEAAAARFPFDPRLAFVVGDKAADVNLGRAVGARSLLVRTGWGEKAVAAADCQPDALCADLAEAALWIEQALIQAPPEPR